MKKLSLHPKKLLVALFVFTAFSSQAQVNPQGTHTLTTSNANIIAAMAKIELIDLNGKPDAIIIATPVGNAKTLNPHPNGVWYYGGKWNFFNSDQIALVPGLTYNLTYFVNRGPDQFLHEVTQQTLALGNEGSYITHGKLDNNPNAQFAFFQNHSPILRPGSVLNQWEEKIGYSSTVKKWYITNVSSSHPLLKGAWYNIVISPGPTVVTTINPTLVNGAVNTTPTTTVPLTVIPATTTLVNGAVIPTNNSNTQPCNCPASLPPNGQATGDLTGMYPNPMVQKILGRFLSTTPPVIGQTLKWNGNEWRPADDISAGEMQTFFKVAPILSATSEMELSDVNWRKILTLLSHSIVLTKNSRLVISAGASAQGPFCPYGCADGKGVFFLRINGTDYGQAQAHLLAGASMLVWGNFSNYMVDLGPGTYNIEFVAHHSPNTSVITIFPGYSSIMVIPIQ